MLVSTKTVVFMSKWGTARFNSFSLIFFLNGEKHETNNQNLVQQNLSI